MHCHFNLTFERLNKILILIIIIYYLNFKNNDENFVL